jgi:hypothetical protein
MFATSSVLFNQYTYLQKIDAGKFIKNCTMDKHLVMNNGKHFFKEVPWLKDNINSDRQNSDTYLSKAVQNCHPRGRMVLVDLANIAET